MTGLNVHRVTPRRTLMEEIEDPVAFLEELVDYSLVKTEYDTVKGKEWRPAPIKGDVTVGARLHFEQSGKDRYMMSDRVLFTLVKINRHQGTYDDRIDKWYQEVKEQVGRGLL